MGSKDRQGEVAFEHIHRRHSREKIQKNDDKEKQKVVKDISDGDKHKDTKQRGRFALKKRIEPMNEYRNEITPAQGCCLPTL